MRRLLRLLVLTLAVTSPLLVVSSAVQDVLTAPCGLEALVDCLGRQISILTLYGPRPFHLALSSRRAAAFPDDNSCVVRQLILGERSPDDLADDTGFGALLAAAQLLTGARGYFVAGSRFLRRNIEAQWDRQVVPSSPILDAILSRMAVLALASPPYHRGSRFTWVGQIYTRLGDRHAAVHWLRLAAPFAPGIGFPGLIQLLILNGDLNTARQVARADLADQEPQRAPVIAALIDENRLGDARALLEEAYAHADALLPGRTLFGFGPLVDMGKFRAYSALIPLQLRLHDVQQARDRWEAMMFFRLSTGAAVVRRIELAAAVGLNDDARTMASMFGRGLLANAVENDARHPESMSDEWADAGALLYRFQRTDLAWRIAKRLPKAQRVRMGGAILREAAVDDQDALADRLTDELDLGSPAPLRFSMAVNAILLGDVQQGGARLERLLRDATLVGFSLELIDMREMAWAAIASSRDDLIPEIALKMASDAMHSPLHEERLRGVRGAFLVANNLSQAVPLSWQAQQDARH